MGSWVEFNHAQNHKSCALKGPCSQRTGAAEKYHVRVWSCEVNDLTSLALPFSMHLKCSKRIFPRDCLCVQGHSLFHFLSDTAQGCDDCPRHSSVIDWLVVRLIDWLIGRSIDWLVVRLMGWLIDWLIDWFHVYEFGTVCNYVPFLITLSFSNCLMFTDVKLRFWTASESRRKFWKNFVMKLTHGRRSGGRNRIWVWSWWEITQPAYHTLEINWRQLKALVRFWLFLC